jgi:hypothetical protein
MKMGYALTEIADIAVPSIMAGTELRWWMRNEIYVPNLSRTVPTP